jgi:Flp pilus assembly pilin Flp
MPEYALLIATVVVLVLLSASNFAGYVSKTYTAIGDYISTEASTTQSSPSPDRPPSGTFILN